MAQPPVRDDNMPIGAENRGEMMVERGRHCEAKTMVELLFLSSRLT